MGRNKTSLLDLDNMSIEEAYAEYRRLRGNIALKRFRRLEEAGYTSAEIYRSYAFIKNRPASRVAPDEIKKALADVRSFIAGGSKVREVTSAYRDVSESLAKSGYKIAPTDVPEFRRFMQGVTDRYGARRESSSAADMYSEMKSAGLLKSQKNIRDVLDHFDWYRKHMDDIEEVAQLDKGKRGGVNLAAIRKKLK